MAIEIDPERFLRDLHDLRAIGAVDGGVQRVAYSAEDRAAREWLAGRFGEAGLEPEIDGMGTVHGRWPDARRVVLAGSHSDTVPRGGWLDGALGVVAALEAARALRESGSRPALGVDVVSFADEEGTFHGTLGSSVFCGEIGDAQLDQARNVDGVVLREALREAGYLGRRVARLDPGRHAAFIEAHIEQGPRLEAAGVPIGVVTAIVGMRRFAVSFSGRADHAGTTPMHMREDAGAAAIRFAARVLDELERDAGPETVWNIGSIALHPGAGNVVPSQGEVLVEYRDSSDELLHGIDRTLKRVAGEVAGEHGRPYRLRPVVRMAGCLMDEHVIAAVESAAEDLGVESMRMPSGAGHDSMILRRHIPAGMLFVPSIGGRSHDVSEDTSEEHLVTGARVLARALERLVASPGAI